MGWLAIGIATILGALGALHVFWPLGDGGVPAPPCPSAMADSPLCLALGVGSALVAAGGR